MEMNFASKGAAATGIALGASALGVSVLKGGLGALFNGVGGCPHHEGACCHNAGVSAGELFGIVSMANGAARSSGDTSVTRYEASQAARIAELETEVKLRDANTYTDGKLLDLYKYVDGKFACVEGQISAQAVYNATNTATLNCISGQVAQLMALTKTVIPASSICPEVMPLYNSWTAPAAPATGA